VTGSLLEASARRRLAKSSSFRLLELTAPGTSFAKSVVQDRDSDRTQSDCDRRGGSLGIAIEVGGEWRRSLRNRSYTGSSRGGTVRVFRRVWLSH
jgi:hypothetical protein